MRWGGGQGGCELRSESFVKIQKKKWGGGGVQGGCEWRSETFVKIQKKKWGGQVGGGGRVWVGGGFRVDVNGEVKLL